MGSGVTILSLCTHVRVVAVLPHTIARAVAAAMAVCGGSGSGQVAPRGCSGHADGGGHVARCATHRAFASFGRPVHGGSASCLPCRPLLLRPMLHLCLRPLLASRCRH